MGLTFNYLQAYTNGRLHAPNHKVLMSEKGERYTLGLFSDFKKGCILEAPEELVDEEHPKLFKPFEVSGFNTFHRENGHKYASSIQAYCGI